MTVTPEQFAELITQAMQDPDRMGSDPEFGVSLMRVGSGYHLKPVGDSPKELVMECYRLVYTQCQPSVTVVAPI